MTKQHTAASDLQCIHEHLQNGPASPWRWVFYGDSITHGAAHTHGYRDYTEIFSERLRWELQVENKWPTLALDTVIKTAYSGWTTVKLLENFQRQVADYHPNFVNVMIGTNDMVYPEIATHFKENLRLLVQRIREIDAIPLLHTCTRVIPIEENPQYVLRFQSLPHCAEEIRIIAKEQDVLLVDNYANWPSYEEHPQELQKWLGEPIHPGARGHLEVARLLMKTLGIYSEESKSLHPQWLRSTEN